MKILLTAFVLFTLIGCDVAQQPKAVADTEHKESVDVNSSNTKESVPIRTETLVNAFDFENFAFPVCPKVLNDESFPQLKSIKLKDGKLVEKEKGASSNIELDVTFYLSDVSYYDLTNDNHLDAVVTIGIRYFQGTDNCTFIYSLKDKKPKLLWTHEYENGIRKLSFEQGGLLIEQYNDDGAVCCPATYSRLLFNWNGKNLYKQNQN